MKKIVLSLLSIVSIGSFNAQQTIALVEQFNGHRCVNCPAVNDVLDSLQNHYQDSMVYVNIHADLFADPMAGQFSTDYTNPVSEDYYSTFSPIGVPIMMSNRMDTTGALSSTGMSFYLKDDVGGAVADIVQIPSPVDMVLSATYDASINELDVSLQTQLQTNLNGDYNVVFYLVEDHLISPQEGASGTITNYDHRNVLRDAMNGTWGALYCTGLTTLGTQVSTSVQYNPDPSWNLGNCKVIAYIRNIADERIIQVAYLELSNLVGINDVAIDLLQIYPNPSSNYLSVEMPGRVDQLQLNIYNSLGQMVKQNTIRSGQQQIDISTLASGTYLLKAVADNGGTYSNTLIIP